jgi:excisionase family DNA binding protein
MPTTNQSVPDEPTVSSGEAAARLGVSDFTIRRWARNGMLPAFRFGRNFRFVPSEIEAFKARGRIVARAA